MNIDTDSTYYVGKFDIKLLNVVFCVENFCGVAESSLFANIKYT